ncbi:hypothetical protein [Streptomyces bobili]|uniref:hypothetical protein n=1 Tax=Streptomyces bobili TaxID=67280 RepID=UPI0037100EB5
MSTSAPLGPHLPDIAVWVPADEPGRRSVVVPEGKPDEDGNVLAYSALHRRQMRVPVKDLHPLPDA